MLAGLALGLVLISAGCRGEPVAEPEGLDDVAKAKSMIGYFGSGLEQRLSDGLEVSISSNRAFLKAVADFESDSGPVYLPDLGPGCEMLDGSGQIVDPWGTPFAFSTVDGVLEIRSLGPDRRRDEPDGVGDDVVRHIEVGGGGAPVEGNGA